MPRGGAQGGARSIHAAHARRGGAWALPRSGGLPPPHCSPSSLAHADPVCYTRAHDSWKQGACGTLHAAKRGDVSGGQSGRDTRLNVVET